MLTFAYFYYAFYCSSLCMSRVCAHTCLKSFLEYIYHSMTLFLPCLFKNIFLSLSMCICHFFLGFFFFCHTSHSYLSSLFGHNINQANYGLWAKSSPLPAFLSKVLLELSHSQFVYALSRCAFALQRQQTQ